MEAFPKAPGSPHSKFGRLLKSDSGGGIALMSAAALALVIANSPAAPRYFQILDAHIGGLSVLHWINDALMAIFFLLVGLEIKREFLGGELSTWSRRALPTIAAVGGMICPAIIYVAFNLSTPHTLRGWAIPAATDIAFALGVLALLGRRVPASLKIFLTALAIIDDLGAVIIIAVFYTTDLAFPWLALAGLTIGVLPAFNRIGIQGVSLYLLGGALLWFFVLKSGVHTTLAGIVLAMTIPLPSSRQHGAAPASRPYDLEHALHPWVNLLVLPLFALANAGVSFSEMSWKSFLSPVTLGSAFGLFFGKQLGVFVATWIAIKFKLARRPSDASFPQIFGVSLLCGIGFTMSLFIGVLAFPNAPELQVSVKVGVLLGSLCSALVGFLVLRFAKRISS